MPGLPITRTEEQRQARDQSRSPRARRRLGYETSEVPDAPRKQRNGSHAAPYQGAAVHLDLLPNGASNGGNDEAVCNATDAAHQDKAFSQFKDEQASAMPPMMCLKNASKSATPKDVLANKDMHDHRRVFWCVVLVLLGIAVAVAVPLLAATLVGSMGAMLDGMAYLVATLFCLVMAAWLGALLFKVYDEITHYNRRHYTLPAQAYCAKRGDTKAQAACEKSFEDDRINKALEGVTQALDDHRKLLISCCDQLMSCDAAKKCDGYQKAFNQLLGVIDQQGKDLEPKSYYQKVLQLYKQSLHPNSAGASYLAVCLVRREKSRLCLLGDLSDKDDAILAKFSDNVLPCADYLHDAVNNTKDSGPTFLTETDVADIAVLAERRSFQESTGVRPLDPAAETNLLGDHIPVGKPGSSRTSDAATKGRHDVGSAGSPVHPRQDDHEPTQDSIADRDKKVFADFYTRLYARAEEPVPSSVWKDLEAGLARLKSDKGKVEVSKATITVTVRDYPDPLAKMGEYIEELNMSLPSKVRVKKEKLNTEDTEVHNRPVGAARTAEGRPGDAVKVNQQPVARTPGSPQYENISAPIPVFEKFETIKALQKTFAWVFPGVLKDKHALWHLCHNLELNTSVGADHSYASKSLYFMLSMGESDHEGLFNGMKMNHLMPDGSRRLQYDAAFRRLSVSEETCDGTANSASVVEWQADAKLDESRHLWMVLAWMILVAAISITLCCLIPVPVMLGGLGEVLLANVVFAKAGLIMFAAYLGPVGYALFAKPSPEARERRSTMFDGNKASSDDPIMHCHQVFLQAYQDEHQVLTRHVARWHMLIMILALITLCIVLHYVAVPALAGSMGLLIMKHAYLLTLALAAFAVLMFGQLVEWFVEKPLIGNCVRRYQGPVTHSGWAKWHTYFSTATASKEDRLLMIERCCSIMTWASGGISIDTVYMKPEDYVAHVLFYSVLHRCVASDNHLGTVSECIEELLVAVSRGIGGCDEDVCGRQLHVIEALAGVCQRMMYAQPEGLLADKHNTMKLCEALYQALVSCHFNAQQSANYHAKIEVAAVEGSSVGASSPAEVRSSGETDGEDSVPWGDDSAERDKAKQNEADEQAGKDKESNAAPGGGVFASVADTASTFFRTMPGIPVENAANPQPSRSKFTSFKRLFGL